jgi:hypothetical protein
MTELKLVGVLLKSIVLWIVLLIPKVLSFTLGSLEALFRVLKETLNELTRGLKREVLKQ